MHTYSYLALGDSYTIGETLLLHESFPYQTVQLLRKKNHNFCAPEIIARTGWTSEELRSSLKNYRFMGRYDFVSLLIGVNNQYRGMEVMRYKEDFEELLQKAIELANGKKDRVAVLSIPDYSATPFTQDVDRDRVSKEVEVFNGVNKALSIQYKVPYVDITTGSREARNDAALVASDTLHPSAKEYEKWALKLAELMQLQLK
jgi:lysophospholipase L1-like esterase